MREEERASLEEKAAQLAAERRQHGNYEPPPIPLTSQVETKPAQVVIVHKSNMFLSFCWALTIVGALIGALIVLVGIFMPGAPQQAALAAIGCAFVIIPYCLARSVSELIK